MCTAPVYAVYAPAPRSALPPKPKPAPTRPVPERPIIHITSNVSEEEDSDSSKSRSFGERRSRRQRPMPLTGLDELPLEDVLFLACTQSPRAAPLPRASPSVFPTTPSSLMATPMITHTTPSPSPLHLTFADGQFSFPKPPRYASPVRRAASPALSISSMPSPSRSLRSPVTSEDELPVTPVSHPLRLGPTKPLNIHKSPSPSPSPLLSDEDADVPELPLPMVRVACDESDASDNDGDSDTEWYAAEFAPLVSLRTPRYGAAKRESFIFNGPARPESYLALPANGASVRRSSSIRLSRPRVQTPASPSAQLDPFYPASARRARRSVQVMPAPRMPLPTVPEPAASSPTVVKLRTPRFPPRNPVPVDIFLDDIFASALSPTTSAESADSGDDSDDFSVLDDVPFNLEAISFASPTPHGGFVLEALEPVIEDCASTYTYQETEVGSNQSVVGFPITPTTRASFAPPSPSSSGSVSPSRSATPYMANEAEERVLRSRWSSSTLGSIASPAPTQTGFGRHSRIPLSASKFRSFLSGVSSSPKKEKAAKKEKVEKFVPAAGAAGSASPYAPPAAKAAAVLSPVWERPKDLSHLVPVHLANIPAPPTPAPSHSYFSRFSPGRPGRQRRSMDSDRSEVAAPATVPAASPSQEQRPLGRRDSRESIDSADSNRSLPTRKAIPIELFMRN